VGRWWCAAALIFLAGSPSCSAADAAAKPVAVPFESLRTRHMAVMIKVNGKGPYRVIFDTGAPVVLLNNKVARESGVLPKDFTPPLFQLFGTAGEFNIKTLEIGALKAENVMTVVMDHPTLEAASKALGPLDGIVGFPFFARYRMTIDYEAKELSFVPNGFDPPDVMQTLAAALLRGGEAETVIAPAAQWGLVIRKDAGDESAGVTVIKVLPGSAAAAAGIRERDRILTLDGRWTDSVSDCYAAAALIKPGTPVKLVLRRQEKEIDRTVTPRKGL
jgi:hypothetical protein